MKIRIINIVLLSLLSFAAMAQNGIIIKTGAFNSFEINQPLDVYLHQSDSSYIELKGNDVDRSKVKISNEEGHLKIQLNGSGNINSLVHIYCTNYTAIYISSASDLHTVGQLKGDNLKVEANGASDSKLNLDYNELSVILSGASDMAVYGRVDTINLNVSGASDFDSYGTKNTNTNVVASGSSDINVNPDSNLVAQLSGACELRFKNEPAHKNINSSSTSEYGQQSNSKESVGSNNIGVYEDGDTVKIDFGNGRSEIIIIDSGDGVKIQSRKKSKKKFVGNWAGVELGVNGYMDPSGSLDLPKEYDFLELKYEDSRNFNLNFMQQSFNIAGNKFGFVTGLGFRWLNYRIANNTILSGDSAQIYGYKDTDPTRSYTKSKLTAWYLMMPLIFEFQTNSHHRANSFHLGVGVIGGLKLGSHSKQVYTTTGGGSQKQKVRDSFHLQPFVLDATARIGWGPLNLFATYSLIDMFRTDRGPVMRPFTVGIILPFT